MIPILNENELRVVVQFLFPKVDVNKSNTLDVAELANFFNQAFKELGYNIVITQDDAMKALQKIDKNFDRVASV